MGRWHKSRSLNLSQNTRPYNNQKKKKKELAKLSTLLSHRIKLIECDKRNKYLDLAMELKKLWNMQVMIVLNVIGAFGTVTKGL